MFDLSDQEQIVACAQATPEIETAKRLMKLSVLYSYREISELKILTLKISRLCTENASRKLSARKNTQAIVIIKRVKIVSVITTKIFLLVIPIFLKNSFPQCFLRTVNNHEKSMHHPPYNKCIISPMP